ncbi:MAG: SOS response-associated peptidase family protein [Geminicoccaceae bacterium]
MPWSCYTLGNRQLFLMAGLWNPAAHPATGARVASYTVVTTEASEAIRLHDRMPAILDGDAAALDWLRPGAVPTERLGPWPAARLRLAGGADAARNSPARPAPAAVEPAETPPPPRPAGCARLTARR